MSRMSYRLDFRVARWWWAWLGCTMAQGCLALCPSDGTQAYLVEDVTVIAVSTVERATEHRDVLICSGRIERVVAHPSLSVPTHVERLSGRGKFVIPGLMDAHAHVLTDAGIKASKQVNLSGLRFPDDHQYDQRVLLGFLRAGVTVVVNMGGNPQNDEHLFFLKGEIAAGRMVGPQLIVGKFIDGRREELVGEQAGTAPSDPMQPTNAKDGTTAVRSAKRAGYDFVKPYQHLNRETYLAVLSESKRSGLRTSGHLPELGCDACMDIASAFAMPVGNIAHAEELGRYGAHLGLSPKAMEELAGLVSASGVSVTPTLVTQKAIIHMYLEREVPRLPAEWEAVLDPIGHWLWQKPQNRYLSAEFRAQQGADQFPAIYDFSRVLTRELWRRGVSLMVGTDALMPGLTYGVSVHQEMLELRSLGLPALDVLRAATINGRRFHHGKDAPVGVVEGAVADLVLLEANPLDDIRNISKLTGVFVHGRWLTLATIDALQRKVARSDSSIVAQLEAMAH